jgi:hypothetical protein
MMNETASLDKKCTAAAASSGDPMRPRGYK